MFLRQEISSRLQGIDMPNSQYKNNNITNYYIANQSLKSSIIKFTNHFIQRKICYCERKTEERRWWPIPQLFINKQNVHLILVSEYL